jgi:predicted esterase
MSILRNIVPITCLAAALALGVPARAQADALADVRPGQTAERITSASDTAQHYAVYLPPGYTADRAWPVLFAMDPRGRAMVPMRLFRPAAERLGWIVVSSYNTASDVDVDPNPAAVGAMLDDVQRAYSIDGRRLYLAGFSGTARAGWEMAMRLGDHVAGIIGFGAGTQGENPFLMMRGGARFEFAFFTGAGNLDFNYDEVRTVDQRLDGTTIPHRFAAYPGPHSWGPLEVCTESLEWMELQAVKRGLAQRPQAWLDSAYTMAVARAEARAAAGDRVGALARWRQVVADFGDRRDVRHAEAQVAELASSRDVRDALEHSLRTARRDSTVSNTLFRVLRVAQASQRYPTAERLIRDLNVADLKRQASLPDTIVAHSAARLLESALSYAAFYGPKAQLANQRPERALVLLQLARAIDGEGPQICYSEAQAHARMGHTDAAFAALECLAKAPIDPALLERDAEMAPLRADPRFAALLQRLRAARAGAPAAPPQH